MTENAQGLVDVGKLILRFANVNRATFNVDGTTPESDTDHTVMMAVCACALAEKIYPQTLDRGLVAQFALVHDLVEAYADDTDTFGLDAHALKQKEDREHVAYVRIQDEFQHIFPWIPEMIERYERLDTREACFVKTVDKCMTKITHILNSGAYFTKKKLRRDEMWNDYQTIVRGVEIRYGKDFPEVIALIDELILEARIKTYGS